MSLRFVRILLFLPIFGVIAYNTRRADISDCFGYRCPPKTLSCRRYTTVAQQKQFLDVIVDCLGNNREKLKTFSHQISNPYDPGLHFESYSYSTVYEFERPLIIGNQQNQSNPNGGFYNYHQT